MSYAVRGDGLESVSTGTALARAVVVYGCWSFY